MAESLNPFDFILSRSKNSTTPKRAHRAERRRRGRRPEREALRSPSL